MSFSKYLLRTTFSCVTFDWVLKFGDTVLLLTSDLLERRERETVCVCLCVCGCVDVVSLKNDQSLIQDRKRGVTFKEPGSVRESFLSVLVFFGCPCILQSTVFLFPLFFPFTVHF